MLMHALRGLEGLLSEILSGQRKLSEGDRGSFHFHTQCTHCVSSKYTCTHVCAHGRVGLKMKIFIYILTIAVSTEVLPKSSEMYRYSF